MENVEEKGHINGREWSREGERADRKKKLPLFRRSNFIQLFENVTNVNISKKTSVFIYLFLNQIQITEVLVRNTLTYPEDCPCYLFDPPLTPPCWL